MRKKTGGTLRENKQETDRKQRETGIKQRQVKVMRQTNDCEKAHCAYEI